MSVFIYLRIRGEEGIRRERERGEREREKREERREEGRGVPPILSLYDDENSMGHDFLNEAPL
jgi:hypothetical protein